MPRIRKPYPPEFREQLVALVRAGPLRHAGTLCQRRKLPSGPFTRCHEGLACIFLIKMEAPPGFEPGMEVLQTSALPLGYGAVCEG